MLSQQHPEALTPAAPAGNQAWRLLLITLLSCFATSGAALGAFLWLINLPPTANCDNPATATTDRAQLFCAQTAAESGALTDVLAALDLVGSWPTEHPLHSEVQPLIEQWSRVVLQAAEQELRTNGTMAEAQALISHIPVESPVFAEAQATLQTWQAEWAQGNAIMATAQTALQQKDWVKASQQVLALAELKNTHWRGEQVQTLSRQIHKERRAQDLLAEAIATATPGGSDRLETALRTASRIDDGTYAHQQAQPYLDRWSDLLLKLGLDKWYASDLDAAITLGQSAALNPSRAKVAQELIWLGQARQMAQQSLVTWRTSPDQLVRLYQAMLVANRVPKGSPYYVQAQSSVTTWRSYLGDLAKLQTAQGLGQVHNTDTLKAAITQAAEVPLGHPRRLQAQTMVAHWRQEIERLEDRPYLVQAHEAARPKTFEALQSAIQIAATIPLHRPLRSEAQSWIYVWTNELQVMADRPILDQARSLAAQGKLSQAIVAANGVQSGRALYDEAQAAIAGWRWEIAAAEQARLRALRRAAAPPLEAAPATPAVDESLATTEAEALEEGALASPPSSPSLWYQRLRERSLGESPLPDYIDTIPGEAPPTSVGAPAPAMPRSPETPVDPATDQGASDDAPSPPAAPAPAPAPAPTPALVAPPLPAPQPVDVVPEPVTPAGEPQVQQPLAPTISTQPQPENGVGLTPRWQGPSPQTTTTLLTHSLSHPSTPSPSRPRSSISW